MTDLHLFPEPGDPRVAQVELARLVLRDLRFDDERQNERSALVLLALLELDPETSWAEASNPMLRTFEIMQWARERYDKNYAPNSRETVRRFTLHQFAEAALVLQNPDKPDRPINSPKWCYQIDSRVLTLLRSVGTDEYAAHLHAYLAEVPGLKHRYARARELQRIPVTLPGGSAATLSPGGQNALVKQIVEDFCPCYTPGGRVLYLGDADTKWLVFEKEALQMLGVTVDTHGKMPDLVVHMPDRGWLVLLEAASSHGPVDAKRRGELEALFHNAQPGLVFVSCFPSRGEMRRYAMRIAWETEVWCADHPTHLIHYNGERLLGPRGRSNTP